MSRPVVVVESGQGHRVGNLEFLARTTDTPYFNLAIIVLKPGQGVDGHRHEAEDDSFLVLEGTLSLTVGDDARKVRAGAGTFVLVPAGTLHALVNAGPCDVRFLNVHAPGGFDRRIGLGQPSEEPGLQDGQDASQPEDRAEEQESAAVRYSVCKPAPAEVQDFRCFRYGEPLPVV